MRNAVLAALALAALGAGAGQAWAEDPYARDDIHRAFDVMDLFVAVGDDYHLEVDAAAANLYPVITDLDVEIALVYAAHSDAIVDALRGGPAVESDDLATAYPAMVEAVDGLKGGKLGALFDGGFVEYAMSLESDAHMALYIAAMWLLDA